VNNRGSNVPESAPIRLGLRENLAQFSLLVVINAFVGAMAGMERSILPAIADHEFHLAARTAIFSFIAVFGVTKALTNLMTGRAADRGRRKSLLVGGWIVAVPVPFMLMWAPSWNWILIANALLGVSQGLTWSTTVIMKVDLVGPARRGLAMGLNEFAGYAAAALAAFATGLVASRAGLRPEPFYLGVVFVVAGVALSLCARETSGHVAVESRASRHASSDARGVFWRTTLRDRDLSSVSQAGFVNNLNDGMAWGLLPLFFATAGMTLTQIGTLAAIYPGVWSIGQLATGPLSDRTGRKWLIASGMWIQAIGISLIPISTTFLAFVADATLLGIGTAMVYPTLLAAIGDVAHPDWRATSLGVYRFWRDAGYVAGALLAGATADAFGFPVAIQLVAILTCLSGAVVATRMSETRPQTISRRVA
jgi:MFS family permease